MMRLFSLFAILILLSEPVVGEERNELPQSKHVKILRDRSDCSVYGSVKARIRAKYRELVSAHKKISEFAKQSREALVACGASSKDSRHALQEEELADRCPVEYERWTKAGQNVVTTEIEMKEKYGELQSLSGLISYHCGKIPEVPEMLPPEPESQVRPPIQSVTPSENPS